MSFHWPYQARVMARLGEGEPIEFFRTSNSLQPHDRALWTRGIDPAWTVWVETRTHPKCLMGHRRIPVPCVARGKAKKVQLRPEEVRELELSGTAPFKL